MSCGLTIIKILLKGSDNDQLLSRTSDSAIFLSAVFFNWVATNAEKVEFCNGWRLGVCASCTCFGLSAIFDTGVILNGIICNLALAMDCSAKYQESLVSKRAAHQSAEMTLALHGTVTE